MSNPNPKQDSKEKLTGGKESPIGIAVLKKAAEKIPGLDKNLKYTEKLIELQGSIEPMRQLEGISYLQSQVINIIAKLKKKQPTMDIAKMHPASLSRIVSVSELPLNLTERVAIDELTRLTQEGGPTTDYIIRSWSDVIGNAETASKGWTGRLKESFQKDPIRTGALLAAGAAGVYIGYKILKSVFGWFKSDKKEKSESGSSESKEGTSSWLKKLLAALGIMAAGSIIGKDAIKKILSLMKLDDLKEILEKGGAIPDWAKKKISELESKVSGLKKAEEIAGEAKEKTAKIGEKADDLKNRIATKENKEIAAFDAPRDILIAIYCYSKQYSDEDKTEIRNVFDDLRGIKMSEILKVWNKHSHKENIKEREKRTISRTSELPINNTAKLKNIYTAIKIMGTSFLEYKKLSKISDAETMTLKVFLSRIHKDPTYKITANLQSSLVDAVKNGDPAKIEFSKINTVIEEQKEQLIEDLSTRLGIDLTELKPGSKERDDFKAITFRLYRDANLNTEADYNLKLFEEQNRDPKALNAAKQFFNKVKTLTLTTILPKSIEKFNITDASEGNEDILKNALKDGNITFKHAIQLCIVSKDIDFNNANKPASPVKEMALLYVLLKSIPDDDRKRYMGELASVFMASETNINFPSLIALKPYLAGIGKFAKEAVGEKLKGIGAFLAAFVNDRSPKRQKEFIENVKKAGVIEFTGNLVTEGGAGALRIGKQSLWELAKTCWETGKIPYEKWKSVESLSDFVSLITAMGGLFIFGKDGPDKNKGVIQIFGKEFFIRPVGKLVDSIKAMTTGDNSGIPAGLKVYAVGTAPYIVIGAASGFFFNTGGYKLSNLNRIKRAFKGSLRGLAAPVTLPIKGAELSFRAGRAGYEKGLTVFNWTQDTIKYQSFRPTQNISMLLRDGQLAKHYFELGKMERTGLDTAEAVAKGPLQEVKRYLAPYYNEKMRFKYAKRYLRRHNKFFNLQGTADELRLITGSEGSFAEIAARAENINEFLNKIKNHPDFLSADAKRMTEIINEAKADLSLKPREIKNLLDRVESKKGLKKLKGMLSDNEPLKIVGEKIKGLAKITGKEVSEMVKTAKAEATALEKGIVEASAELKSAKNAPDAAKAENKLSKLKKAKSAVAGVLARLKDWNIASKAAGSEAGYIQLSLFDDVINASKAVETAGQVSKLRSVLKIGGIGLAGLGAGVSLFEAGTGFYRAATTNVEGRAGIEAGHATLWAVNGAADTALAAAMCGAKGSAVKLASRAWGPLVPITWAGTKAYESIKEGNLKDFEWAQKYTYNDLVHQWFTTIRSRSEGDAVVTGFKALFSSETINQKIDKDILMKKEIAHKIFRVLVATESNPEMLRVLYEEGSSDEKDKKIEKLIEGAYTKYHEYYFQMEGAGLVTNYETAKTFIANACAFNEIMQMRERKREEGAEEFKIGDINLIDERFEITGDNKNPKAKRTFMPSDVVKHYKDEMLSAINEISPGIKDNLDKMETSYLLLLYAQTGKYISQKKEGEDLNKLVQYSEMIRLYLKTRDVNVNTAIQNPMYFKYEMSLDRLLNNLDELELPNAPSYKLFERENIERRPEIHAIYRLAQYFGYTGNQKENELKNFFSEDKANFQGVYWKGDNWYVQKEGWDLDTKLGSSLNYNTIEKMISELYQNADNILEHRKSGTFVTAYDFSDQVKKMAGILQAGYNEGIDKYNPREKKLGHIAPSGFEKKEVGKTENLKEEYEKEIDRIKSATGWSQMKYEVKDNETVILSRADTSEKTTIKKSGDKWDVGEHYAYNMTFTQAVVLGNMLNYTKKLVKEGNWRGGKSRPFEVDGNSIDFDKAWSPFDTRLIDGSRQGNWLNFMSGIGVSRTMITDTLNNWFQREYHR